MQSAMNMILQELTQRIQALEKILITTGANNAHTFCEGWLLAFSKTCNEDKKIVPPLKHEMFQKDIHFNSFVLPLLFDITVIKNELLKLPYSARHFIEIPIDEFLPPNQKIDFTKVRIHKGDICSTEPIIMIVREAAPKYTHLVLDGNHRISKYIADNRKYIKAEIIEDYDVVEKALLTEFQKNYQMFTFEVHNILHYLKYNSQCDIDVKNSYFNKGDNTDKVSLLHK